MRSNNSFALRIIEACCEYCLKLKARLHSTHSTSLFNNGTLPVLIHEAQHTMEKGIIQLVPTLPWYADLGPFICQVPIVSVVW